jgi:hypothetical protein
MTRADDGAVARIGAASRGRREAKLIVLGELIASMAVVPYLCGGDCFQTLTSVSVGVFSRPTPYRRTH